MAQQNFYGGNSNFNERAIFYKGIDVNGKIIAKEGLVGNVTGNVTSDGTSTLEIVNSTLLTADTIRVNTVEDISGNVIISSDNYSYGKTALTAASSATAILQTNPNPVDGLYWINVGGTPRQVFCSFDNNGYGWMLAMRMQYNSSVLGYTSGYWTNTSTLNPSSLATDEVNIKNYVFNDYGITAFKMCASRIGTAYNSNPLEFPNGGSGFGGDSLREIFNSGNNSYNSEINMGRTNWLNWVEKCSGLLRSNWDNQPNCNEDRINANYTYAAVRIGISMNNEADCLTNDSVIGFGCYVNATTEQGAAGITWNPTQYAYAYGWLWIR